MIRCTSVDSASPAKHGKTFTSSTICIRIMEAAPQCRPVWAHSRVLMMPRPLANCCVLAARWNVNGSTCDYKLHRGATQLAAPPTPMFIWDTTSTFVCVQERTAVERRQCISISRNLNLFVCLLFMQSEFVQTGEGSVHWHRYKPQSQKVQINIKLIKVY